MNYRDDNRAIDKNVDRNTDRSKIPFYMTYPMQNMYLAEMEYEKDMERMKEWYPREVRQIQDMIERRCDEMEYEGSRMYDENPDRYMLEEEARRMYERFLRENPQYHMMMPPSRPEMPMEPRPMPRPEMLMEPRPMPRPEMPMNPRPMPSRSEMPMNPRPMPSRPEMPMEPRPMPQQEAYMERQNDMQMQQYGRNRDDTWLRNLIRVLFHDEIYRRRCRNRRCRRWW